MFEEFSFSSEPITLVDAILVDDSGLEDDFDHIRTTGDNQFRFEDLADGGDFDFNDMIINVDF